MKRGLVIGSFLLLAVGCVPASVVVSSAGAGASGGHQDGTTTSASTDPSQDDTAGGSETGSFLEIPDLGTASECNVFVQDCPAGFKCTPWANDGGGSWNAQRCSPLADEPGEPGDPCRVEGSGVSGIDDCELGAMCFYVDPETLEGTCVGLCAGDLSTPVCDDPITGCSLTGEGIVNLCIALCDPVAQDCPAGQACYPTGDEWQCIPDASGDAGAYGDPCDFINVCDPGLICLGVDAVPGCVGAAGCCTEVCDLNDPQCTGEGQTCQPWYDDDAPHGYEHVGACALPS